MGRTADTSERNQARNQAIDELYRQHAPGLRRQLRALGVSDASLPDALQDVFLVLVRRYAEFDVSLGFRAWLRGIARGVASTHRRSSARRRARLTGPVELESSKVSTGSIPDTLEFEARAQALWLLGARLDRVDDDKLFVFVACDLQGWTAPEVARHLGVSLATVRGRLRAARRVIEDREGSTQGIMGWPMPWGWLHASVATACLVLAHGQADQSLTPSTGAGDPSSLTGELRELSWPRILPWNNTGTLYAQDRSSAPPSKSSSRESESARPRVALSYEERHDFVSPAVVRPWGSELRGRPRSRPARIGLELRPNFHDVLARVAE